ncbi:MAG: DNA polymerase I [Oscillospiraceae bacterium]|jgi:DNA polymerase-1|nr:DNA polymerase I [Oscillospiraceae bacterium]
MKLLVIDGNSIANRAFYGIRPLSNKAGVPTHASTGFLNIYLKLLRQFKPDAVAVAFDVRKPTFRAEIYPEYKANRKGMPDELAVQLPYIKQLMTALGVTVLECGGYEADDILGTLANAAASEGNECILATGDRDAFQLVNEKVSVNLAKTNDDTIFTPELIQETYGITPAQMLDVKALMGDSSDNIPGVKGIGEKTAFDLIKKYGSVDYIYENLDSLEVSPGVKKKLSEGSELCFLSRRLGLIATDAPVSSVLEDYILRGFDNTELARILTELEMFSFMKKFNIDSSKVNVQIDEKPITENAETEAYPDVTIEDGGVVVYDNKVRRELDKTATDAFLSGDEKKRTYDLKALWNYAFENSTEIKNVVFDAALAAYLLGVNASEYTPEQLYSKLQSENMLGVLNDIEIPLTEVLVSMERCGIELDKAGIEGFGEELRRDIDRIQSEIYELANAVFNISSPKQLGEILFDKLSLPHSKKTKTGYSTNADVLEDLADKHPIIPLITEYRALTKLNSTYVAGLLKIVGDDNRIHTTFMQTITRTGRISSVEPNIQNIPVRTPRGRQMRRFFRAKSGCMLVDADYSQIELRVLAHISDDDIMKRAFAENEDIHTITASQVFGQPPQWITPELRTAAKAVNFGIVYGIGAFSLAKDIGVSVAEANNYIKSYLAKYKGVKAYMDEIISSAKKTGCVATMFGRRRYISEINASNKNVEAAGKRIAMNTPIQGTAADIIKIAMIRVYRKIKERGLKARLILQVHDELIAEAPLAEMLEIENLIREEMEAAAKLSAPLRVDVKSGKTWFDAH